MKTDVSLATTKIGNDAVFVEGQRSLVSAGRKNWKTIGGGPNPDQIKSIQTDPHW